VYYVISEEVQGGDAFFAMYDAAAATDHTHRDGTTLMGYLGPNLGVVTGRVAMATQGSQWVVEPMIEAMYGPLNFVLD